MPADFCNEFRRNILAENSDQFLPRVGLNKITDQHVNGIDHQYSQQTVFHGQAGYLARVEVIDDKRWNYTYRGNNRRN